MATWTAWNNGTANTAITTGTTWSDWNLDQNFSTTSSTDVTWNQWATTGGTASSTWIWWTSGPAASTINYPEPTEEERETARLADEERVRQRKEAEERAEKILTENLDDEQRKSYTERKVVPITTAKGRKYLIKKGQAGNVYRIDEHGKEIERFCIHPEEVVPDQDTMLAQLLWLRWMEKEFLEIANKTNLAA